MWLDARFQLETLAWHADARSWALSVIGLLDPELHFFDMEPSWRSAQREKWRLWALWSCPGSFLYLLGSVD